MSLKTEQFKNYLEILEKCGGRRMKAYEIRKLIENYYDIQKIRIETFNRIVSWVKENKEEIKECLKNLCRNEKYSHITSHLLYEPHEDVASQQKKETQSCFASHKSIETQIEAASRGANETHEGLALKILEEAEKLQGKKKNGKYSEFVKKFVLSHKAVETQTFHASQPKNETHEGLAIFSEIKDLIWFHNQLYKTEKELQKRLDAWSKNHRLRKEFLNYVKGIGGVLASGIIAWLSDAILKAEHPSSIWKYCGLYPGSERKKGEKLPYNLRLKAFCWKIGQSFIKFKCFGRKLYEKFREETKQKHPDWNKSHIHNYVRRKVVKVFLACLWRKWREMNNLPTPLPYAFSHLQHSDLITPNHWIEKEVKDYDY